MFDLTTEGEMPKLRLVKNMQTDKDDGLLPHLVIIGGGFTGAAMAIALMREHPFPCRLTIVEPAQILGGGLAYGRARPEHILNSRASDLTVDPERPDDFVDWIATQLSAYEGMDEFAENFRGAFLPRRIFAHYMRTRLIESMDRRGDVAATVIREPATIVERGRHKRWRVIAGEAFEADIVILATGYGLPARRSKFGRDPYGFTETDEARKARSAVIIGSGLSMADAFLTLRQHGFTGAVTAVSRHGLLPRPHAELPVGSATRPALRRTLSASLRAIRKKVADGEAAGLTWQALLNSLRPVSQDQWLKLKPAEQSRFLRHAQPYWDAHRHRLPPKVHRILEAERAAGNLELLAGRALAVDCGAVLRYRARGAKTVAETRPDIILDCSGYRADLSNSPIAALVDTRQAFRDPHDLGLQVAKDGRVRSYSGTFHDTLFALGPLGRGSLFEITAVPEIVAQCAAAAEHISDTLLMTAPQVTAGPSSAFPFTIRRS